MNKPFLIILVVSALQLARAETYRGFEKLTTRLEEKNLAADDLNANFEYIESWLSVQCKSCRLLSFASSYPDVERLVKLYHDSSSLNRCAFKTFQKLVDLKHKMSIEENWDQSDPLPRPVHLLRLIAQDLAKECADRLNQLANEQLSQLDKVQLETLNSHFDHFEAELLKNTQTHFPNKDRDLMRLFMVSRYFDVNLSTSTQSTQVMANIAEERLDYDVQILKPDSLSLTKKQRKKAAKKLTMFIEDEYIEPCDYYVSKMRTSMVPLLEIIQFKDYRSEFKDRESFYRALGRFRWCLNLQAAYKDPSTTPLLAMVGL